MKLSPFSATATLTALIAVTTGHVHAEEYQGVLQFQSSAGRGEIQTQATVAAHTPNPYAEKESAAVAMAPSSPRDRDAVRAEAVARAQARNQNLRVEAFADSRIPAYYNSGSDNVMRQAQSDAAPVKP